MKHKHFQLFPYFEKLSFNGENYIFVTTGIVGSIYLQNQFFIKSVSYKNVLYHFQVCKSHNTLKLTDDASRINNISITMFKEIAFQPA